MTRQQRKKEDEKWTGARLFIELLRALLQLATLILPIIHGCLYFAPSDLDQVVGAETHTDDENLIAYYCQDPESGDFSKCTSDEWELVAPGLPPVVGVASDGSGNLILLFDEEGYFWTGDVVNGPTQQIIPTQDGLVVIDIAANETGAFVAACRQGSRVWDCFNNNLEFVLQEDQKLVALTFADDSNAEPVLWCGVRDAKHPTEACLAPEEE